MASGNTPQYGVGQYGTSQYSLGNVQETEETVITSSSSILGQQFTINVVDIENRTFSLETRTVFNQFDEQGLVLGLSRIRGESNKEYRRRLLDVFVHRANSAYRGLIHGITRELGLSLFQPLQINPKTSLVDGRYFTPDPYIKIDGAYIYLYSDYRNGILDYQIDRFDRGINYGDLGKLVNFINTTTNFEASIESGFSSYIKSMTLINQSNREQIPLESVSTSTCFQLDNDRVVPDSLYFDDSEVFGIEVDSNSLVTGPGKYCVNYRHGIIRTYDTPGIDTGVQYEYSVFPFKPVASNVILHNINSEEFRIKMFEQVLQADGTYVHGLPTELGVDIINELMSVTPMYWGI